MIEIHEEAKKASRYALHQLTNIHFLIYMKIQISFLFALSLTITPMEFAHAGKGLVGLFAIGQGLKAMGKNKLYGPETLTVNQLEGCVTKENELDGRNSALEGENSKLEITEQNAKKIEQKMTSLERDIDMERGRIFRNQDQVDKFNSKVNEYNTLVVEFNNIAEEYEKERTTLNSKIEQFTLLVAAFNAQCVGKYYYEEDMASVRAKTGIY